MPVTGCHFACPAERVEAAQRRTTDDGFEGELNEIRGAPLAGHKAESCLMTGWPNERERVPLASPGTHLGPCQHRRPEVLVPLANFARTRHGTKANADGCQVRRLSERHLPPWRTPLAGIARTSFAEVLSGGTFYANSVGSQK